MSDEDLAPLTEAVKRVQMSHELDWSVPVQEEVDVLVETLRAALHVGLEDPRRFTAQMLADLEALGAPKPLLEGPSRRSWPRAAAVGTGRGGTQGTAQGVTVLDDYKPIDLNTRDRLRWWLDSLGEPSEVKVTVLAEHPEVVRKALEFAGLTLASVMEDETLLVIPAAR